jgi:hypothetical protein
VGGSGQSLLTTKVPDDPRTGFSRDSAWENNQGQREIVLSKNRAIISR